MKLESNLIKNLVTEAEKYSDSNGKDSLLSTVAQYLLKTPKVQNQPPFLEIGTRAGGSALLILRIIEKVFENPVLITIDPYGDKPYDDKPWKYGPEFYIQMKRILSPYGNHIHYHMTSEEFIQIMDKISLWYQGHRRDFSKFSFIFLDGSHDPEIVKKEFSNLFPRLIEGGYIVVDNTDYYNGHMRIYFETLLSTDKKIRVTSTSHQSIIHKVLN